MSLQHVIRQHLVGVGVVVGVVGAGGCGAEARGRARYQAPTDTPLRDDFTTNGCSSSFTYFGRCL